MTGAGPDSTALCRFDPDAYYQPVVAMLSRAGQEKGEVPVHQHRKGQLVLALRGVVTCEVPKAMWIVPPDHAVWIPGGMPHSNRVTENAEVCFVFLESGVAQLPDDCCTLPINTLVRELVLHLAAQGPTYSANGPTARLATVLLDQLPVVPAKQLSLPISENPKLRFIANALTTDPSDRSTLSLWASRLAMSDRTLARLVERETGLTFGRWRQQLHLVIALRQLASGDTVQQVAGALGYDSVTAFITMFKKAFGQPPGRYFAGLQ